MTDQTNEARARAIVVEQRHRDAAANRLMHGHLSDRINSPVERTADQVRAGKMDDHAWVQAFARFERDHLTALDAQARQAGNREALQQIEYLSTNYGGWFETDPWAWGQMMGDAARAALTRAPNEALPADAVAEETESDRSAYSKVRHWRADNAPEEDRARLKAFADFLDKNLSPSGQSPDARPSFYAGWEAALAAIRASAPALPAKGGDHGL